MWNEKLTYLTLLTGSILFPLIFSFEKNVHFVQYRKELMISILVSGLFFIVWDVLFTYLGFWSFNSRYVLGPHLLGLPFEEWLFFVVIPYCSLFIYEVAGFYLKNFSFNSILKIILNLTALAFLIVAFIGFGKWYTFITLLFNAFLLAYFVNNKITKAHLSQFVISFLVACVPMLVVNGVLTSLPVVEYNSLYFSNVRIADIPVEDFSYFLLLMTANVLVYERVKVSTRKQMLFGRTPLTGK